MSTNLVCRIHPVVLFTVIDSYERRNEDARRVVGSLLGYYDKGAVEITNCFAVPHNESEQEVALDIEYAREMFELYKKVNSTEIIVGWYSTGSEVSGHSVLIHEYYSRECKIPIHLTIDTSLKNGKMGIKGYISTPIGVPGKTTGTMFTPVPVEYVYYEPEKVGVNHLQEGKYNPKRTVQMVTDLAHVETACHRLQEMLTTVIGYIDDVLSGKVKTDNTIGRFLMNLINQVPQIDQEEFESMLNSNMKDLLMVVYLANFVRTQLAIHEKINILKI
ncbi:eukaryotic translation initiation factor 3 subunit F [Patella vulgata]|uniref:Eukaryotic translation initiation factor 3 subunit F n=1 Tax=Patella caerulea TaxID=87958 RepID=A0AAN8JA30_PATCE|nr:eukaryotic translation initiation factor 3 subunit F [Patella vulgata]